MTYVTRPGEAKTGVSICQRHKSDYKSVSREEELCEKRTDDWNGVDTSDTRLVNVGDRLIMLWRQYKDDQIVCFDAGFAGTNLLLLFISMLFVCSTDEPEERIIYVN